MRETYTIKIGNDVKHFSTMEEMAAASNNLDPSSGLTIQYGITEADGFSELTKAESERLRELCVWISENQAPYTGSELEAAAYNAIKQNRMAAAYYVELQSQNVARLFARLFSGKPAGTELYGWRLIDAPDSPNRCRFELA